jgi:hypothetical protein
MKSIGVDFFLAYGTLLGILRDGDLLPYDKDMDVGLFYNGDKAELIKKLSLFGFVCPYLIYLNEDDINLNISLFHEKTGIGIDLFFFRNSPYDEFFESGFNHLPCPLIWKFRKFELEYFKYLDIDWKIPFPVNLFLEDIYGSKWKTPDPNFDSLVSGFNISIESKIVSLSFAFNRLFEQLRRKNWDKAVSYCNQLISNNYRIKFASELIAWINKVRDL